MTKIKFCIWDVGKVIYDYNLKALDEYFRSKTKDWDAYQKSMGVLKFDYDPYMKGEVSFEELCTQLCEKYNVPMTEKTFSEIARKFEEGIGEIYSETQKLMKVMKSLGIKNGILSNALPVLEHSVDISGVVERENIFCSFALNLLKPDPEIYKAVRERLGCAFEEIIFIDDKAENIEAACNLGIHGIVYDRKTIEKNLKPFCENLIIT